MRNLSELVLSYVSRARNKPVEAGDPRLLDTLEKSASSSVEGSYSGLAVPIAEETWEARTLFLGANLTSERVPVSIPFPTVIVGMIATIEPTTNNGLLLLPGKTSIDVSVDVDNKSYLTSAQGFTSQGSTTKDGTFVTLALLDLNIPRIHNVRLESARTSLGVTFRWKRGAGVYNDAIIGLGFLCRRLRSYGQDENFGGY